MHPLPPLAHVRSVRSRACAARVWSRLGAKDRPRPIVDIPHQGTGTRGSFMGYSSASRRRASGPRKGLQARPLSCATSPALLSARYADLGLLERRMIVPSALPPHPDLRRLRDLARTLQRGCRSGDPSSQSRLLSVFPDANPGQLALSKALAVVARDYGYPSWPSLKAEVEARRSSGAEDTPRRNSEPIYEGKAKILYEGSDPGTLIQYFKDDTTAFDAGKTAVLSGKGAVNNRISGFVMARLETEADNLTGRRRIATRASRGRHTAASRPSATDGPRERSGGKGV